MNGDDYIYGNKGHMGMWNSKKGIPSAPRTLRQPIFAQNLTDRSNSHNVAETSLLNAEAQEFVPSYAQEPVAMSEEFSYLYEAIEVVTLNPGRYEEFLPPIRDIVESFGSDQDVLSPFVDIIIEQCIVEPNFRYSGARMCGDLTVTGQPFINVLLNRCGVKHRTIQAQMNEDRSRMLAFTLLLAELFLHVRHISSSYKQFFSGAIYEFLNILVWPPSVDGLKTACQILKLCGATLENEGQDLEVVFNRLGIASQNMNQVDESVQIAIMTVLQMRRSDWVRLQSNPVTATESNHLPLPNKTNTTGEPVFYGPDGQVLTEEENLFLRENVPLSEDMDDYILEHDVMDDEACAAFEEFISLSTNKPGYRY